MSADSLGLPDRRRVERYPRFPCSREIHHRRIASSVEQHRERSFAVHMYGENDLAALEVERRLKLYLGGGVRDGDSYVEQQDRGQVLGVSHSPLYPAVTGCLIFRDSGRSLQRYAA